MEVKIIILIGIVGILLPGNLCLGGNVSSADKETAILAAKILIGEIKKQAGIRKIDEEFIYDNMKGNPEGKYTETGKASDLLKGDVKTEMKKWYDSEIQGILGELDKKKPKGSESYFKGLDSLKKFPEDNVNSNLDKNYSGVFSKARERACEDQMLTYDVYPSEQEFDTARSKNTLSTLRSKILDSLVKSQREQVFSENQSMLNRDFISPVFKDAEKQWKGQMDTIERSQGGPAVTTDGIGSQIRSEVGRYQEGLKAERKDKKIANKVYDTFPSVKKSIPGRASDLAGDKFANAMSSMEFVIQKEHLKPYIKSDLAKHSNRNQSRADCLKWCWNSVRDGVINTYIQNVSESQRKEFGKFLDSLISGNGRCNSAFAKVNKRTLNRNFDSVRQKIRDEQFSEFFGPIEKDFWRPSEDEIDKQYKKMSVNVPKPLKMPNISTRPFDPKSLLEETVKKVKETEESIIRKGVSALKSQMDIIEGVQPEVRKELEAMPEVPSIDRLTRLFTGKVKSRWSSSGLSKEYDALFKRAENDIKEKAKYMLPIEIARREKIEKAEQAKVAAETKAKAEAKAESAGGGGFEGKGGGGKNAAKGSGGRGGSGGNGKGDGKGDGEGKEAEKLQRPADVFIDLDYQGEKITATIYFLKSGKFTFEFVLDFNGQIDQTYNKQTMEQTQRLFETWLASIETQPNAKSKKKLFVVTRVFDGRVYYGVMFDFREALKRAAKRIGNEQLEIHWYDGLFEDNHKGKLKILPEMRKLFQPLKGKLLV